MERVALDLCVCCLNGYEDQRGAICGTGQCANYKNRLPDHGFAPHVKLIATFNQQEAEAVLRLINAAKAVMDEADWLSKPFMEHRDAIALDSDAGCAEGGGFDLAALAVPSEPPDDTASSSGEASLTQGTSGGSAGFAEALTLPRDLHGEGR